MSKAMIPPKFYAWDRNGKPLAFGKVYTYQSRTNAEKPTYKSEDSKVENTNPVILSGEGYADIYLSGSYKIVVKDSNDNEIWSADPVAEAESDVLSYMVTAYYISSTSFKALGNHTGAIIKGGRVKFGFVGSSDKETTVLSSAYDGEFTVVLVEDALIRTDVTAASTSTGFGAISNFQVESKEQLEKQEDEFQSRFSLTQPAIEWQSALIVEDNLQLYSTGLVGESGYSIWLPDPNKTPFTASSTFAEDQALDRWKLAIVSTNDWTEEKIEESRKKSELEAAALAAGTTYDNITYSTNLVDSIKGYIFDATGQITYAVPEAAQGKFISSVIDGVLTTTDTSEYELLGTSRDFSTERALLFSLGDRFSTKAFYEGWSALSSLPIGGCEFIATGDFNVTNKSNMVDGMLYDASGKEFAIKNRKVSPQMFGASNIDDDAIYLQNAIASNKPVFLEGDITLKSETVLSRKRLNIDLNEKVVTLSLLNASSVAINTNSKSKLSVYNGDVTFTGQGKFVYGRVYGLHIKDVDIIGGTLAIQTTGVYTDKSKDIRLDNVTHKGRVAGEGGFFSGDGTDNVYIIDCVGEGGGEFIDVNNLCAYWTIKDCRSTNYKQNHYDINSGWHIKVINPIVISTISGLTSRPIWVSDHTKGSGWDESVPERLKNSNFVSFINPTLIIENFDYKEAVIFNVGTEYNPYIAEGRKLVMKWEGGTTDCRTPLSRTFFKFGILKDLIRWSITGHEFLSCGVVIKGSGKVNSNTFDAQVDFRGIAMEVTLGGGSVSMNEFYGWSGGEASSPSGGTLYSNSCNNTNFTSNNFVSGYDCYAVISSNGGGTNRYIQNGFSMVCGATDGVRENGGDVTVYSL